MSFKIGDKVKMILGGTVIYDVVDYLTSSDIFIIRGDLGNHCTSVRKISSEEMFRTYIKVDMYGNPIKEDGDQLSWYDGFLVPGKENKEEKYCNHDWKVYTGLNFSDEYCTKCNKKREIEKK